MPFDGVVDCDRSPTIIVTSATMPSKLFEQVLGDTTDNRRV